MRVDRFNRFVVDYFGKAMSLVFGAITVVILAPFMGLGLALGWWDERYGPVFGTWTRWYAWRPVSLGWYGGDCTVWLETVERTMFRGGTLYRRPGDTSVKADWEIISDEDG